MAAWQACLGGAAGRALALALTRTPAPDGGYARRGGLHPPPTPGRGRRGARGPGSRALVGVGLAGSWLVLRPETRALLAPPDHGLSLQPSPAFTYALRLHERVHEPA
jgi:hypothetical protein